MSYLSNPGRSHPKLYPGFLEGVFEDYTAGPHSGFFVELMIDKERRVVISCVKNGPGRRVVALQLYYSHFDNGQ